MRWGGVLLGVTLLVTGSQAFAIDDAAVVHVPADGLDFFASQVEPMLPTSVDVPSQSGTGPGCVVSQVQWWFGNAEGYIAVDDSSLIPGNGQLQLHLDASFAMSGDMETWGCLFNNSCNVWVDWSPLSIDVFLDVQIVEDEATGERHLHAELADVEADTSLLDPDVYNCSGAATIEETMADMKPDMEAQLVNEVKAQVPPLVDDLLADLDTLELSGSFALGDTELDFHLEPSKLALTPDGVELLLAGDLAGNGELDPCIPEDVPVTSAPGTLPVFGTTTPGGDGYRVGGAVSAGLLNQAVTAAWRSGFLCLDVDRDEDGQHLDTTLLRNLGGDAARVLTEGGDMLVQVRGAQPPQLTLAGGGAGGDLQIDALQVDVFGEVHGRLARVVGVGVATTADVSVGLADAQIVTDVALSADRTTAELSYAELIPETAPLLVGLMPSLFVSMAPPLDDLVPPIELPALAGLTLHANELTNDGDQFLSLYADVEGQVDPAGCSADPGGCTGCHVQSRRPTALTVLAALLLGVSMLLRRRHAGG